MKPILTSLIIVFISSSALCLSLKKDLKVAIYDFPPHVIATADNEKPQGAAVEFLEETLNIDDEFKIVWMVSPFSRFLSDMELQRADMGLLLVKTPAREKLMRYADHSIFTTDSGVILAKGFSFTNLNSLSGLVLGHTQGSVIPEYFKDVKVKFDALSGEDVVHRNLQRMKLKRIDGVFVPTYSNGEYLLKKFKMDDQFKIEKIPNTSLELYIVFRKDIDEKTFKTINGLIEKKRTAYSHLLEKYLWPQKKVLRTNSDESPSVANHPPPW